ncbi:hypothetical protein LUZ60_010075 [Juncus effusus]|nr:hypothetical protein LUZ60_010075 [Juncus effusus]
MALLCSLMEISPLLTSPNPRSSLRRTIPNLRVSVSNCACGGKLKDERKETRSQLGRVITVSDPIRDPGPPELGLGLGSLLSGPLLRGDYDSTSISTLEKKKNDDDDKREYYVNMGYAIRTLREEFPLIFYKEPNFDIYREDIVFRDPLNTFYGLTNYKRIFYILRLCGRILFKSLTIEILSIWQPSDSSIMIRWIAHGIPRVPWNSKGRFDATSEYKLDKDGKIYEHKVDNVAWNSKERFRVLEIEDLVRMIGCGNEPKPTFYKSRVKM